MIRDTIAAVQTPLPVVRHHDIVACNIGPPGSVITICVIYRPPDSNAEQDLPLINLLNTLFDAPQRCLVLGDLNANQIDWPSMTSTAPPASFEAKLTTSFQDLVVFQHVREPTRYRGNNPPSLLDVILTKDDSDVGDISYLPPLAKSDHRVLRTRINWRLVKRTGKIEKKMYKKVNVAAILEYATTLCWTPEPYSPELAWSFIKGNIQGIDARFVPIKTLNNRLRPKWFTRTVRRALAIRNELYGDYIRLPSGQSYRRFLLARSRADSLRNKSKATFEQNIASHMKDNKKSFYAYVRSNAHNRS